MNGQSVRNMIPPLDPFAQKFDSIEVSAGASSAYEQALAMSAPSAAAPEFETPGFYLLNDAGGRFTVDRDLGVVSLRDEALLANEHGAVHDVRLRVVENSGASYELAMQLRVTGLVPQMVGKEDFTFAAAPVPRPAQEQPPEPVRTHVAWATFTATHDSGGAPSSLSSCGAAPYGALLCAPTPSVTIQSATLALGQTPLPPASKDAVWSI